MRLEMNTTNKTVLAALVVAALAVAFWVLEIGPKRDEAGKLDAKAERLRGSLARHRAEIAAAEQSRKRFPVEYQRLVVLGKAVPGDDETPSLLVQLNQIANGAGGTFQNIKLSAAGGEGESTAASPPGGEGKPASPTEVAAALLPLGATVGPAGLAVMPYEVTFNGNFFQIADFVGGLDSLVKTNDNAVKVDGRLVTIDGFSLTSDPEKGFPDLQASFALTTYLTPPGQGAAAGASPEGPGGATATPAATITGGAP
jgi:Tfp pilus assembly protein PilO